MPMLGNKGLVNAHESTHEGQSHRLKTVVFTKCVDNKRVSIKRRFHQVFERGFNFGDVHVVYLSN